MRLTLTDTLDRLRVSSIVGLMVLNPCRDAASRVKALCEGTPDASWMSWMTRQNVEASRSRLGVGSFGAIALMVCVFVTVLTFLLVFGLVAVLT